MVLFSDPKDFAREGRDQVYPHTVFMPGMAVQSGTVWLHDGDPVTPFYPSLGDCSSCFACFFFIIFYLFLFGPIDGSRMY